MWYKYMQGISLVLAGIITMSMKVMSGMNAVSLRILSVSDRVRESYNDGTAIVNGEEITVFTFSPLTYVIGALLIIAGGFSIYTAYKEDNHAN